MLFCTEKYLTVAVSLYFTLGMVSHMVCEGASLAPATLCILLLLDQAELGAKLSGRAHAENTQLLNAPYSRSAGNPLPRPQHTFVEALSWLSVALVFP